MTSPVLPPASKYRQRGVVLFVALLLLLVLTLAGLAATRNTTHDERMAADRRDQDLAFQAAEAALRYGESLLQGAPADAFNNTAGYYDGSAAITWETADWTGSGGNPALQTLSYAGTLNPSPAQPPRFYLVKTGQAAAPSGDPGDHGTPVIYKIIAKGWGATASDTRVLESLFEVRGRGPGRRLSWQQLQ